MMLCLPQLYSSFVYALGSITSYPPRSASQPDTSLAAAHDLKFGLLPLSVNSHIDFTILVRRERLKPTLLLTRVLCLVGKPFIQPLSVTLENTIVWDKTLPRLMTRVFPVFLIRNDLRLRWFSKSIPYPLEGHIRGRPLNAIKLA